MRIPPTSATYFDVSLPTLFINRHNCVFLFTLVCTICLQSQVCPQENRGDDAFVKQVAPILVARCLECHNQDTHESDLSLVSQESLLRGGESGKALVVAGKPSESLLWQRIEADEMPPKHPLSADEKLVIKNWLESGAAWGASRLDPLAATTDTRAGRDWWSLQPLRKTGYAYQTIDGFIQAKLAERNLQLSPPADRRTLIRRAYFDVLGLPPTPEVIEQFVNDPDPKAFEKLTDRLLAMPQYGERWGRHWLDVVRFGESDGFERNQPRENAWPYRDWVIQALNDDLPYDQFVRQQLIGDQLNQDIYGAASTGFWTAGVHNTVVGGSKRMKILARQDEIEEVLATVGQTFVGLAINCARCHDHKFDPVTQTEYYQFASTISGLGYGDRKVPLSEEKIKLKVIEEQLATHVAKLRTIDREARLAIIAKRKSDAVVLPEPPKPMARWEFDEDLKDSIGKLHGKPGGTARCENGALILDGKSYVVTDPITTNIGAKTLEAWVELTDLDQRGGAALSLQTREGEVFDAIVYGEREPKHWMAGSNGFVRTDSFGSQLEESDAASRAIHVALVYADDGTIRAYRDGQEYGHSIRKTDMQHYSAGEAEVLFGLRHDPPGGNRFLNGKIHRAAIYDRALSAEEVALSSGNGLDYVSEPQLVAALTDQLRLEREALKTQIAELTVHRDEQANRSTQTIYTLTPAQGEKTSVLLRGDPDNLGKPVRPGATSAIGSFKADVPNDFGLPEDAPEADRRRELANWIIQTAEPLFARVIVNRVWHYHFGTGIVETPSDFGFNGGRPSHPELLDFLAQQFIEKGFRLKWLHREIMLSATYQQAGLQSTKVQTALHQDAIKSDADNRLLWHFPARRLEAEVLRDSMLSAAGRLNENRGGPSFKDVSITFLNGTTYYEPLDVDDPALFRRTVYRFNPRGGRSSLLDTFDCPDCAATTPRRSTTTTPLQSLSLLNDGLVLRLSEYFAQRVSDEVGQSTEAQIERAWKLAIGRAPNENERKLSIELVNSHKLQSLCRGLFNLSDFVVIE